MEGLTKILKTVVIAADLSEIQTRILSHTSLELHLAVASFASLSNVRNPSQYRQFALEFCLCLSSPRGPGFVARSVHVGFCGRQSDTVSGLSPSPAGFSCQRHPPQSSVLIYSCITDANRSWRLTSLNNPQNVILE